MSNKSTSPPELSHLESLALAFCEKVEKEALEVTSRYSNPLEWIDKMPHSRAAFEEAMRLYPPAPTISRNAIQESQWKDLKIATEKVMLIGA